jgi:hypothetical protein
MPILASPGRHKLTNANYFAENLAKLNKKRRIHLRNADPGEQNPVALILRSVLCCVVQRCRRAARGHQLS